VTVHDRISNLSTQTIPIANTRLQLGGMAPSEGRSMRGVVNLGVDSLSPGGEKTKHWSKKLDDFFKDERKEQNLPKLPITVERRPYEKEVHWVAVKNKYFVQILTPEEISDGFVITAKRELAPEEKENPSFSPKMTGIERVSASIILPAHTLQPGEVITQQAVYYVGPKKYTELAGMGLHNAAVMEFGIWAPVSRILLRILNAIYDWVWPHNYGLAIILMTILIRIVFWPFTHKSTESMKRMQEIQPLVKSLREKYKDNPQKLQQETMALYKEHKVNPLGGCLPMLIQIPVFIALFVVLRSAIELRFASFLWIKDLSQPENLLAGAIPIVGALNILPLLMAFTMFLQQKLSPTGGDPQQQKVMAFMPIMLLVLLYNMASGLVLYWTTNQCLMIIQQLTMRRKQSQKKAASDGG
jgi:YidC/Oxa1 family membrane protein insertase